jgi:uncharacterized repeat protein (TIGR02543 family)
MEKFMIQQVRRFALLFFLTLLLVGCTTTNFNLDEINIDAVDQIDIPAGTYQVQYTIEELSDLVKNHGAVISIVVLNKAGQAVVVSGNSFTVEENEEYAVTIKLTMGQDFKEKTITVKAIVVETLQITVSFHLNGGTNSVPNQVITSGTAPVLPTTMMRSGFEFEGWYLDEALLSKYAGQILTANTTLYAKWIDSSVSTAILSFQLAGGVGYFPDQTVSIGEFGLRPSSDPTKESYLFLGWFVSEHSSQPFVFETMQIYHNTVVYAQWEYVNSNNHRVTYDLNGALQTTEITEMVTHGNSPVGLSISPIRPGHIFIGWSFDHLCETAMDLASTPITSNVTIYAVWHVDFEVIIASSLFNDVDHPDNSTLNEGYVEQRKQLNSTISLVSVEFEHKITDDVIDYGIIYSHQNTQPDYYGLHVIRIRADVESSILVGASFLRYEITTLPLLSDTSYFYRFFIRYEQTIVYSDVYSFSSYINVPTATAVGARYVLSGGYYRIDNGTEAFRPSFFVEILEGFSATIDGNNYVSYSYLYREGTRSLVTTEIQSGKQYLHVFTLDFQTPHVSIVLKGVETQGLSVLPTFAISFPHFEHINYPIDSMGVLYSTEHFFVKKFMPHVINKVASLNTDGVSFTANSSISVGGEVLYVRGYVIINDKLSYSPQIYKLQRDVEGVYQIVYTYYIDESKLSLNQEYNWSFGNQSVVRAYQFNGEELVHTTYNNNLIISEPGQYFLMIGTHYGINDVLIIDDFIDVVGIVNNETYVGSVYAMIDVYNPEWYFSFNGEEYITLPSKIRFSLPGYYEVFYRDAYGYVKVAFTITSTPVE